MSHHARIEEVSDSDPDDMDPADFDPSNFDESHIISPANVPSTTTTRTPTSSQPQSQSRAPPPTRPEAAVPSGQRDIPRNHLCLYPVYFDKTRSRAQGRKVGRKIAVANPLAREIVDAVQVLGLKVGFEGDKLHPKDWANPGRVRVGMKRDDGVLLNEKIQNKHHLYILVAKYLQAHPTTEETPFRLRIRGLPMPEEPPAAPPAPRGWKMGNILPIHSPALSGGGVSDNPFKEAMAEMQGIGGEAAANGGGEGKKKKDKKKGKA